MTLYRKAIRAVQPPRAEMARRHAPYLARMRAAQEAIRQELANGADAAALYAAECARRRDGSPDYDADRATVLLGVLRRGPAALD